MTTAIAPRTTLREVDRRFTWVSALREATGGAALDDEKRRARVVIISEGLGNLKDKNLYSAEAIQSCPAVFEGAQFFVDHPSTIDDDTRPERSMRDLAGYFSEASVGTIKDPETGEDLTACFATVNCSDSEPGRLAYEQIKTAIEQQRKYPGTKNVYCGISINGNGSSHPGTIRGMAVNVVTAIREAFSADIVTKPARGGRFLTLVQESRQAVARFGGRSAHGGRSDRAQGTREATMATARRGRVVTRESEAEVEARKAHLMTDEGMKAFAGKMGRLAAIRAGGEAEATPGDADELLKDIEMDLAALKAIKDGGADGDGAPGDGDGQDEAEARRRAAEDEARRRAGEGEGSRRAGESEEEAEARRRAAEDEEARRRAAEGEGARRAGESEEEAEARRRKEAEDEEEAEARRLADEGEDMGMTGEGEEEAGPKMAFTCEGCGAETEVMAPKGYRLVATESWKRAAESLRAARQRGTTLTGRTTGREARSVQTSVQDSKAVLRENADLRRRNQQLEAVLDAQKVLRESRIPRDILKWESLVTYPRVQWRDRINQALRTMALESKLIATGNRERGAGGVIREAQTGQFDAAASFDKHFRTQG